jgi:hypothetical protein
MVDPDDSRQEWIATVLHTPFADIDVRRRGEIMITRVSKIIVPVQDQQAALDFWTRCLEFTTVRDNSYGDERWIEVKPPNQDVLLVLSPSARMSRGGRSPTDCRTRICSSTAPTLSKPTASSAAVA